MKTISRHAITGLLMAAIFALGAVAGFAQDPTPAPAAPAATPTSEPTVCKDPDLIPASEKVTADFTGYTKLAEADKLKALDNADAFAKKYAGCEAAAALITYVNKEGPPLRKRLADAAAARQEKALVDKFVAAVKASRFPEVYSSGRELIAFNPEKFRQVSLTLATVGYDESINKFPPVTTYNEDALKYAKIALADLQAGKKFENFTLGYTFKSKEDALGSMKAAVGYLTYLKNPKDGLGLMYEATQSTQSEVSKQAAASALYGIIGDYFYGEMTKMAAEVTALRKLQLPEDTPEVAKQKSEAIDAKFASFLGIAERALDAYARSYSTAMTPTAKSSILKRFTEVYGVRYEKTDGVQPWITSAVAKPFPNPTTPVEPVRVGEPAPTTTTSTTPPAATKPPVASPAKPGATTPAKPAATSPSTTAPAKPVSGTKPRAKVKKAVVKRKRA